MLEGTDVIKNEWTNKNWTDMAKLKNVHMQWGIRLDKGLLWMNVSVVLGNSELFFFFIENKHSRQDNQSVKRINSLYTYFL